MYFFNIYINFDTFLPLKVIRLILLIINRF